MFFPFSLHPTPLSITGHFSRDSGMWQCSRLRTSHGSGFILLHTPRATCLIYVKSSGGHYDKMTKPSIQNDFSFYRRLRQRRRPAMDFSRKNSTIAYNGEDALLRQEIEELSDECCSKMSLFYAEATPMLKLISRYATQCHMVFIAKGSNPDA
ncbi:hypothetical protein ACTXT7_005062 [Hymenolepis weldensis]